MLVLIISHDAALCKCRGCSQVLSLSLLSRYVWSLWAAQVQVCPLLVAVKSEAAKLGSCGALDHSLLHGFGTSCAMEENRAKVISPKGGQLHIEPIALGCSAHTCTASRYYCDE